MGQKASLHVEYSSVKILLESFICYGRYESLIRSCSCSSSLQINLGFYSQHCPCPDGRSVFVSSSGVELKLEREELQIRTWPIRDSSSSCLLFFIIIIISHTICLYFSLFNWVNFVLYFFWVLFRFIIQSLIWMLYVLVLIFLFACLYMKLYRQYRDLLSCRSQEKKKPEFNCIKMQKYLECDLN